MPNTLVLNGRGQEPEEVNYPCQDAAQARMSELHWARELHGGLLFPTTTSKLRTVVGWLLDEMERDPAIRVVWAAYHPGSLEEALKTFATMARWKSTDFSCTLVRDTTHDPDSIPLADQSSGVVLVVLPSKTESNPESFIHTWTTSDRPTILVVDEPRSEWDRSLVATIDSEQPHGRPAATLVLTTTANARKPSRIAEFREAFPDLVCDMGPRDLAIREHPGQFAIPTFFDGHGMRIPPPGSPWGDVVSAFALTYNGYLHHDDLDGAMDVARPVQRRWAASRSVRADLDSTRCALFMMQREWHWGNGASAYDLEYVDALLARMINLTGGVIPGPPDPSI